MKNIFSEEQTVIVDNVENDVVFCGHVKINVGNNVDKVVSQFNIPDFMKQG